MNFLCLFLFTAPMFPLYILGDLSFPLAALVTLRYLFFTRAAVPPPLRTEVEAPFRWVVARRSSETELFTRIL